jgi:pimeloyl-ACP methyl ester carboxylesterase
MREGTREEFEAAQSRLLRRSGVAADSRFLDVAAVEGSAHALVSGSGSPVLMVPGFADPAAMWAPLMARLPGFHLHAVDRPCFGLSGGAPQRTATFRRLAVDFLSQALDALGLDRVLAVGNSIGSLWTTWLAIDRPDRVAALVHVGCPAFVLGTSAPLPMRLLSVPPLGRFITALSPPSPGQVEAFGRAIAGEDFSRSPELRDLLVASQKLPGAREAMLELLHAVVRLRGARPQVRLAAGDLAQVRQPVLLVWGSRDAFGGPQVGAEAARALPDARLEVLSGGGHVPWVGHPDDVAAAALPFLRDHAAKPQGRVERVPGPADSGSSGA